MSIAFWPTIQNVAGGAFGSPVALTRDGQWTIIAVDSAVANSQYVELPANCDIGDVVEVHNDGQDRSNNPQVSCPSGEVFAASVGSIISGPKFFRKISASAWGLLT